MNEKPVWTDQAFALASRIGQSSRALYRMADCFFGVGQEGTGELLSGIANDLELVEQSLRDLVAEKSSADLAAVQQASIDILATALAVVK